MANKTAFLIMDMQVGCLSGHALPPPFLPLLQRTLTSARSAAIPVIYITIAFRPGHPEISLQNATFGRAKQANLFVHGAPETAIHEAIRPEEGDILVEKKR
ncbi:hypothetical protein LSUE1_G005544, partial [Lachnellula suecica]